MKIALIGNPNSGKTTLFNTLTGSSARVGNWPGVTVDKKVGTYKKLSEKIEIVDLPGIYSLSPYTPEEVISRNYLINEKPDAVINIIDATNLERNLYLTTQLLEIDIPVVIALNMSDVVAKSGDKIDVGRLQKSIGVPVVEISALRKKGVHELMEIVAGVKPRKALSVLSSNSVLDKLLTQTEALYRENKETPDNLLFHAVKMIEGDSIELEKFPEIAANVQKLSEGISLDLFGSDVEGAIADSRYKYIAKNFIPALKKAKRKFAGTRSDKADRILTDRFFGLPIFLLIMFAVFHFTFSENILYLGAFIPEGSFDIPIIGTDSINSIGVMLFNLMDLITSTLGGWLSGVLPEGTWYTGLIMDGILGGVFGVLSFVPQILVLYFFIGILEDSGYMARVAFILDRVFRRFGLSGRAFLPLLTCFGCAIPGIAGTRTLEDPKERERAIFLSPFFSCGAKMPIWVAFAGVFAAHRGLNSEFIVYSVYILGIVIAISSAIFLKYTFIKGKTPPFIMELPNYHLPRIKNLLIRVWDKFKHYVYRVSTIIVGSIIVIWLLSSFSFTFQMVDDSSKSMIGIIAQGISWLFVPLGFGMGPDGWKFVVAVITGLIAKEMVVATMGTFAGMADGEAALEMDFANESAIAPLTTMMLAIGGPMFWGMDISIPAMFSFLAFNLLSVPCMAAVATARAELGSLKKMWGAIAFWMATAYIVSFVIFWIGVLCTWIFGA